VTVSPSMGATLLTPDIIATGYVPTYNGVVS